jgi:hypothetical protein
MKETILFDYDEEGKITLVEPTMEVFAAKPMSGTATGVVAVPLYAVPPDDTQHADEETGTL